MNPASKAYERLSAGKVLVGRWDAERYEDALEAARGVHGYVVRDPRNLHHEQDPWEVWANAEDAPDQLPFGTPPSE